MKIVMTLHADSTKLNFHFDVIVNIFRDIFGQMQAEPKDLKWKYNQFNVFAFYFLGIFFSYRFSPTRAPSPWNGIRIADKFSPVCPQRLPNIQNETGALEKMPKGRLEYLKRLLPFLQNQSEDCLYLNVFSPAHGMYRISFFSSHHWQKYLDAMLVR